MSKLFLLTFLVGPIFASCPHQSTTLTKLSTLTNVPGDDDDFEITEPLLLDTVTPRFRNVVIKDGGRLVFDPDVDLSKLTAERVTIDKDGSLEIGSATCKFEGKAEILLTGVKDNDEVEDDDDFGHKFIGIKEGGALEIHGKDKLSWTRLAQTLAPKSTIYTSEHERIVRGMVIFGFDSKTGKQIYKTEQTRHRNLEKALKSLKGDVIVVLNRGTGNNCKAWFQIYSEISKTLALLEKAGLADDKVKQGLRYKWTNDDDPWVIMVDRLNKEFQFSIDNISNDHLDADSGELSMKVGNSLVKARNLASGRNGPSKVIVRTFPNTHTDSNDIELVDDAKDGGWVPGDKIVIASTDFDMDHAEEFELLTVGGKSVTIKGDVKYTHNGEMFEGMELRAEVGLLTRNVKIHGEMGDKCVRDEELDVCNIYQFDNYGGHIKGLKGFKAYNIEGAELTNMGQMTEVGSYPIHFHMAEDTDTENTNPIISKNSIHHCFSRCVTIHGSHGIHVKDNVAHDTYGHCFFLEDGGEKRTVLDGNLGMTTRPGVLTPSDTRPTTYWITSPLTSVSNNVAAGSDPLRGTGFWFLFPDIPVGPSKDKGFFKKREAKHTPITKFQNNFAHSNGEHGLAVFRRLRDDHGFLGCSTYDPREDPKNPRRSSLKPSIFDGFTAYKNRVVNAQLRVTTSQLNNFKLADSVTNIKFLRNMLSGYQMLNNSLLIQESPLKETLTKTQMRHMRGDRVGAYIDQEGPLHLHNVKFRNYATTTSHKACAIKFKDNFRFGMGVSSSIKGLDFDFTEPKANKICHDNKKNGPDESSMMLRDTDGSLAAKGKSITSDDPFLHEGMTCKVNKIWNMAECEGSFARFYLNPRPKSGHTFLTNEIGEVSSDKSGRIGYTVNSKSIFVMHWSDKMMIKFELIATGLETGDSLILGLCLPKTAQSYTLEQFVDFTRDWGRGNRNINEIGTLEDLKTTAGANAFWDKTTSILYVKFSETRVRGEGDLGDCIGALNPRVTCPFVRIDFRKLDGVDLSAANCT